MSKADNVIQMLKERRKALKMTQAELCRRMPASQACLSQWERGDVYPRLDNLVLWCDALGIDLLAVSFKEITPRKGKK